MRGSPGIRRNSMRAGPRAKPFWGLLLREGELREETSLRPSFLFRGKRRPPLAKTLSGSLGPLGSPRKARVGVLARDFLADREAVVWRGETLLLDPRRKWEAV
jgi:hypothetical protein